MTTLSQVTEIFGWASILNIGFLVFAWIVIAVMRPSIVSLHSKMFDIPERDFPLIYFKYLANYKLLTFIFIVAPYLSLKIIG